MSNLNQNLTTNQITAAEPAQSQQQLPQPTSHRQNAAQQSAINNSTSINPANTAQIQNQIIAENTEELNLIDKINLIIPFSPQKIIAFGLTIQGLRGIYKSVKFIVIDYPLLEQQLQLHIIDQNQINNFANKAVMMIISTIISMFFALKIATVQNKLAKKIHTAIGLLLFFGNTAIHNYLEAIGSSQWLTQIINSSIKLLMKLF